MGADDDLLPDTDIAMRIPELMPRLDEDEADKRQETQYEMYGKSFATN